MDGRQGWKPTRVYIDVMSADIAMVEALREAVLALIGFGELRDGTRFFPAQDISVTDMGEETDAGFIHRDHIDAVIPNRQEN